MTRLLLCLPVLISLLATAATGAEPTTPKRKPFLSAQARSERVPFFHRQATPPAAPEVPKVELPAQPAVPTQPQAPQVEVPATPPAFIIGAWMDPESKLVIHGDYDTARKLALEEDRPLVVLSRMSEQAVSAATEKEPAEAVLTIAPDDRRFPSQGVYRYEPKQNAKGVVELKQTAAPAPVVPAKQDAPSPAPAKLKAKGASFIRESGADQLEAVQAGCPGGKCKRRLRR